MSLSAMGRIADENWRAIPEHFQNIELGAHGIMPNHTHGIIIIQSPVQNVDRSGPSSALVKCP